MKLQNLHLRKVNKRVLARDTTESERFCRGGGGKKFDLYFGGDFFDPPRSLEWSLRDTYVILSTAYLTHHA